MLGLALQSDDSHPQFGPVEHGLEPSFELVLQGRFFERRPGPRFAAPGRLGPGEHGSGVGETTPFYLGHAELDRLLPIAFSAPQHFCSPTTGALRAFRTQEPLLRSGVVRSRAPQRAG